MIVCIVGSGAREHALAQICARTADVIATPGNPGICGRSKEGHSLSSVVQAPEDIEADLFIIGPEAPLVDGLADRLRAKNNVVFGPSADGARLEGSKAFMKELAQCAHVPSARYAICNRLDEAARYLKDLPGPYVVKTDGLAAGKGVFVGTDLQGAIDDADAKLSGAAFGDAGKLIVIEECLRGVEVSLLVLCDGRNIEPLPPAQDYKRLHSGGTGPNTGGMGAYSPVPVAPKEMVETIMETIVAPTVVELRRRGVDYRGVLYAGCMLTDDGPKLIEYNVRFGDPEAQVILPRLKGDVAQLLFATASGAMEQPPAIDEDAAVCVVLAAHGYPQSPRRGDPIHGVSEAGTVEGVTVFHAGTSLEGGELVTAGGRVLTVSALGPTISVARSRAYEAAGKISFPGMQLRSDIANATDVGEFA